MTLESIKWWIVFFAPSAAEFVCPILHKFFSLPKVEPISASLPTARIAAIGPTTASFLSETLQLLVDVVPSKPSPEELSKDIMKFDNANLNL